MNRRTTTPGGGFLKLQRTPETLELLRDRNAFILLTVIALRARRTDDLNVHHLRRGQALLGDYHNYGMTMEEYRSAKKRLKKWSLVGFRSTSRGTIATLWNTRIYDINESAAPQADPKLPTNEPPADHKLTTTNKKEKKEKKEKGPTAAANRSAMTFEEIDRACAAEALAQAARRFLTDGQG